MQGTWKEKFDGSFDRKGNRRKKHNRKHTLKDKAKWHINHSDLYTTNKKKKGNDSIIIEGRNRILREKTLNKKELYVDTFIIFIQNKIQEQFKINDNSSKIKDKLKTKEVFKYRNEYYDVYTKEKITIPENMRISKFQYLDTIYLNWDENIPKYKKQKSYIRYCFTCGTIETLFLYGKPLPTNHFDQFGFYSSKQRKYWQKQVNKTRRRNLQNWLKQEYYLTEGEIEIKRSDLDKSIDWAIW